MGWYQAIMQILQANADAFAGVSDYAMQNTNISGGTPHPVAAGGQNPGDASNVLQQLQSLESFKTPSGSLIPNATLEKMTGQAPQYGDFDAGGSGLFNFRPSYEAAPPAGYAGAGTGGGGQAGWLNNILGMLGY